MRRRSLARHERTQRHLASFLLQLDSSYTCTASDSQEPGSKLPTKSIETSNLCIPYNCIVHGNHSLFSADKLKCLDGCACRCHSSASTQIVPRRLVPYLGDIRVSRRLLHSLGLLPWECNVQTCRRDRTRAAEIKWHLPFSSSVGSIGFLPIQLPIFLSVYTARSVPSDAKVWEMIDCADLDGLRALFRRREASVYDVNENGASILLVGPLCHRILGMSRLTKSHSMPATSGPVRERDTLTRSQGRCWISSNF